MVDKANKIEALDQPTLLNLKGTQDRKSLKVWEKTCDFTQKEARKEWHTNRVDSFTEGILRPNGWRKHYLNETLFSMEDYKYILWAMGITGIFAWHGIRFNFALKELDI